MSFVIGQSDCLGFGFTKLKRKSLYVFPRLIHSGEQVPVDDEISIPRRDWYEPMVFVPEVAKQHDEFVRVITSVYSWALALVFD